MGRFIAYALRCVQPANSKKIVIFQLFPWFSALASFLVDLSEEEYQ